MKAVILAGGRGTRFGGSGELPKPMVTVGGKPILWHIMKHLSHHGVREFVIALGHGGDVIKRFFVEYASLSGDMVVDLMTEDCHVERRRPEDEHWSVALVDTGPLSNTAWRLQQLAGRLAGGDDFLVTYGDGVSDVDVASLVELHRAEPRHMCTLTAVRPPARYGSLLINGSRVDRFSEKIEQGWINGGYMVFRPQIFDSEIMARAAHDTDLAYGVLEPLSEAGQLGAYRHEGFWQCMDTPRERDLLEEQWYAGRAAWKVWT